jgi:uncharacterized protein
MPEDGLRECNVGALADSARRVSLAVPVGSLARIAGFLASPDGHVTGSVALSREAGRIMAEVQFEAKLTLRCQRCLGPQPLTLTGGSRVALLESESDAAMVPPELETALAPQGRLRLADLVEEELLLALPAAPRHAAGQCPAAPGVEDDAAQGAQRPFAGLGELMKRSRH